MVPWITQMKLTFQLKRNTRNRFPCENIHSIRLTAQRKSFNNHGKKQKQWLMQTLTVAKYHSTHIIISNVNMTVKTLKQQIDYLLVVFRCVVQTQKHIMETPESLDLNTLTIDTRWESVIHKWYQVPNLQVVIKLVVLKRCLWNTYETIFLVISWKTPIARSENSA